MKKFSINIYGGLGNQMFQYAAGRALSLRYQVPLCLDLSWFSQKHDANTTVRTYQLGIFKNITATIQNGNSFPCQRFITRIRKYLPFSRVIREPHFAYWPAFAEITPPATLDGYWQSEKYFMDFQKEIRHDFTFPALPEKAKQLCKQIMATPESVSVHIRRGDYVSNPQAQAFHGNLQQGYYNKALQLIKDTCGKNRLFIFSDDPQWTRENFDCCGNDATIIDLVSPDAPHLDMHLMSLCRHHIIANSSFSWWGAWLGQEGGLTIAPRRWFADTSVDTSDIIPEKWIQI